MEDLYERLEKGKPDTKESPDLDKLNDLLKESMEIARRTENKELWKHAQNLLVKLEKETGKELNKKTTPKKTK